MPPVRKATSADREAVAALLSTASTPHALARRALGAADSQGPCVFLAYAEGEGLVGMGMLEVAVGQAGTAPVGSVTLLVVLDAWRGRGVGTALLEALRREAVARGCREVRVATPRGTGRP